jgi:aquaporin Z
MKKYVVELIGTFFLVLTFGMTVVQTPSGVTPPLAIGAALMVMIYAGGHISGAHYNPAVTLAVFLRGRCPAADVPGYLIAQVLGAVLASQATLFLKHAPMLPPPGPPDVMRWLLAEFAFTFALAWVVLNVATAKATAGNSYFGLAIAFTVVAGAFAMGPVSGAAFNPAVAIGGVLLGLASWSDLWIFLVANLGGAALAAVVFKALHPEDP